MPSFVFFLYGWDRSADMVRHGEARRDEALALAVSCWFSVAKPGKKPYDKVT
jgi:hypothetical protein